MAWPKTENAWEVEGRAGAPVLFLGESLLEAPSRNLLLKIAQAIALPTDDLLLASFSSSAESSELFRLAPSRVLVAFGQAAHELVRSIDKGVSFSVFFTHHPTALLETPELKKETWETMKQVQEVLRNA